MVKNEPDEMKILGGTQNHHLTFYLYLGGHQSAWPVQLMMHPFTGCGANQHAEKWERF
jgi:hypothetical protein